MNQRIRELANQMFSMEQFEYAEEFINDEFMEKFAELIIEECCDVVRYIDAVDIKKHFGVE